ncbi:Na(+)/H(+) exchange regulatory cofactor NHE-RF2-like protein [Lates japonicus]|uniref:Na(+)/H(+) exchange regulatory cofactor NHE-RF2-like protein n=1 Tax=Lates japonicus TaxID=270547 RepID=A0AAD3NKS0_LATJO|nr:Na(+)/H(+) exchange regulatory cofactor NHE-RF2-like protein [Lates japonicus]
MKAQSEQCHYAVTILDCLHGLMHGPGTEHTHSQHVPSSRRIGSVRRLQVEPSPEPTVDLLPRLCHLVKGEHGYGFNLHSNKTKRGQFIRSVDPGSAAESADIRPGDRLVEVNGVNIEGLRHSEVVALIREGGGRSTSSWSTRRRTSSSTDWGSHPPPAMSKRSMWTNQPQKVPHPPLLLPLNSPPQTHQS